MAACSLLLEVADDERTIFIGVGFQPGPDPTIQLTLQDCLNTDPSATNHIQSGRTELKHKTTSLFNEEISHEALHDVRQFETRAIVVDVTGVKADTETLVVIVKATVES
ncbi:hypothetical protein PM082_007042 [Marasmius tenuissimus]|nr:hypothetical protein PM082_007042 [Marasmius tenuissimus]